MNARRIFARIWRINAVLILLAGAACCGVLAFAAISFIRDATRPHEATGIVNIAPTGGAETTRLGSFTKVQGTTVLSAPLYREQQYELTVGSKETTSVQNYLFYDVSTDAAYWLLPASRGLVVGSHDLPDMGYGDRAEAARIVFYEIVEVDSNGDQRLTSRDLQTLYCSDPSGRKLEPVAQRISEVQGVALQSEETALVIYTSSSVLRAALVDIHSLRVLRDSAITPPATQ